jgi:XTP/dITP diphosphohydrolase
LSRAPLTEALLPREVVVATSSAGKRREFEHLLRGRVLRVRDLSEFPAVAFPEEGLDYAANARAKALAVLRATGRAALGDDSGLEVEGLGGAPGPLSARYGGAGLDDAGRVRHLLAELARRPNASRAARFVCWIALALPGERVTLARGECRGRILAAPRGSGGFGYDPIFEPEGEARSLAELTPEHKHALSHRGRALAALLAALTL